jgi:hypothetical protein
MRKHIIPFYLEAPTQEILNEGDDLTWNGVTSRIILPAFTADATVNIDAVAAQGKIMPGTILVLDQSGAVTAGVTVTIAYGGSPVIAFDATSESATLLFFDDRDSVDDAGWEVIAKDASTGSLSAVDITLSGNLVVNGNTAIGDAATDTVGFFGATAVDQRATTADVTAASSLPADGTGDALASAAYSQAEVSALIETVYDLMGLVNQLNADLKELGLKASS